MNTKEIQDNTTVTYVSVLMQVFRYSRDTLALKSVAKNAGLHPLNDKDRTLLIEELGEDLVEEFESICAYED